jgi:hypothetical protein
VLENRHEGHQEDHLEDHLAAVAYVQHFSSLVTGRQLHLRGFSAVLLGPFSRVGILVDRAAVPGASYWGAEASCDSTLLISSSSVAFFLKRSLAFR